MVLRTQTIAGVGVSFSGMRGRKKKVPRGGGARASWGINDDDREICRKSGVVSAIDQGKSKNSPKKDTP